MRKLYIARHGETDFNKENRYAGTIDIDLNEEGITQSHLLAKKLSKLPIDVIVCSSKKRAIQTAEIINEYLKKPIYLKEDLVERNIGLFEGLTRHEVSQRYSDLWERNILHEKTNTEHGGESVEQVCSRAKRVLDEVLREHAIGNILIVTHGYLSRMMNSILRQVSEKEINKFLLSNCQFAEYEID